MKEQIPDEQHFAFLKGGGEMGSLIAAYDWSKGPLGPIDSWSVSLRTSLSLMLKSRFPMLIFWGPKLITFYNDAFRPSLGNDGKHPGSLGQIGEESWAESWPVIGPMIYNIMAGGEAVWFEDQKLPIFREGKMEYAYWTYSFSAITNGDGTIEGLLVTCAETTKAVEAIENLKETKNKLEVSYFKTQESEKRLISLFEQSPVAIATIAPEGLTFISANTFYGELVGRKVEEIIGKPLLEALPELIGQGFDEILKKVLSTGTAFLADEVPVDLMRKGKMQKIYVNLAYQPMRNSEGEVNGILVVATHVTSLVESRKSIEENEAKFRALIEEAPIATCFFQGPDHVVEVANDIMLGYWGKDASVIGLPLIEALPELKGQPFIGILDDIYRTGKPYSALSAASQLNVNGVLSTYYFDFTYKPLFDEQGKVYGIMDMAVDVTARVLSEKKNAEGELFSRSIIDNSPVAKIVYLGHDMILNIVNQKMIDLLGKGDEIIGKKFVEVFPELEGTHLLETMRQVLITGETFIQNEERLELVKNGKPQVGYYSYIYKALKNTDGEIYGIIVTANDITAQVVARHKVEEAEIRLSGAIELAELSTWNLDVASGVITYSDRLKEWLGIEKGILKESYTRIVEADYERVAKALQDSLKPDGNGSFDETYTIQNTKTGQQRIIHAHGVLIRDEEGKPSRLEGVAQDVTLQKELQMALEREVQERTEELASANEELVVSNEELAEANINLISSNAELEQYAYVASHDLQEPLRKIQVFSDLLNNQQDLSAESKRFVEKINYSATRMRLLIEDLLEFSRLLNSENVTSTVDLNRIVNEVKTDFELMISEKKAIVEIADLPVINAIRLQMNQLFYNLIGNSLKFIAEGTEPRIKIYSEKITPEEAGKYLKKLELFENYYRISVSDNGIGIDLQYASRIFEVFKRLHSREVYQGSGIGLSVCRRIAMNHHGHLYFESELGKGSVFHIILPQ